MSRRSIFWRLMSPAARDSVRRERQKRARLMEVDDQTLVEYAEMILSNCSCVEYHDNVTYDEALRNLVLPELLRRLSERGAERPWKLARRAVLRDRARRANGTR